MDQAGLTPAEVAQMHRISRTTVYRLIYAGSLTAHRVGIQYRIAEVDALSLPRTAQPRSVTA